MATITLKLSTKIDKVTKKAPILLRFVGGREYVYRAKSGFYITPSRWNSKEESIIIPRLETKEQKELTQLKHKLDTLKNNIIESFTLADKTSISKQWLDEIIDRFHFPEKYCKKEKQSFFRLFKDFIENRNISEIRKRSFRVIYRTLQRYEIYIRVSKDSNYSMTLENIDIDTLRDFEGFLKIEHQLYNEDRFKVLYEAVPESRTPQPRGQNTINGIFTKIRTFFLWALETGKTDNNPFKNFKIEECVYGRPYYITIEERNKLYNTDLSQYPKLAIQRDIFVFQCLIGCRIGDLYEMTPENIIDEAIEYIPRKTKDGHSVVVRVPLNSIAQEILCKYQDDEREALLPFISEQKYNIAIKKAFLLAQLTRPVTIMNPTTRETEIRPLNELASSHLARRCFVGNLYKKVKDPNLVGALSGHKEGSKAFFRYRDIDEDMKRELVKALE